MKHTLLYVNCRKENSRVNEQFIEHVREQFPSLQRIENNQFVAYFDGPGGTQVAKRVIDAMHAYMSNGVANVGGVFPTAIETEQIVQNAREHVAEFIGADANEIVFGENMTSLAFRIARLISQEWHESDGNIVITEMDHHANIDPWVTAAEEADIDVHTIKLNPQSLTLDLSHLDTIINEKTKLVAISLASNAVGTIHNVQHIIDRAKEVGALIALDAVHAVPHFQVNFEQLQGDFLFCSAYKFFGPHIGIVAVNEDVMKKLKPFKVKPAPEKMPDMLETGTINFEALVGVTEAIQFIASLGEGNLLSEQLSSSYKKLIQYENTLAEKLRNTLKELNNITLFQADETEQKTPTIAFRVDGWHSADVCRELAEKYAIHIEYGHFYAESLIKRLNVSTDGVIRAGISPYNTEEEIDRLVTGIINLNKAE